MTMKGQPQARRRWFKVDTRTCTVLRWYGASTYCPFLPHLLPAPQPPRYGAFEGCRSLKVLKLPRSLSAIGDYAFYGCVALLSLKIYGGSTSTRTVRCTALEGCSASTVLRTIVLVVKSY